MLRKVLILVIITMLFLPCSMATGIFDTSRPRVRIDDVEVPLLPNNEPIKVGDVFPIDICLTNERLIFRFSGEAIVYLTCVGICQKEIGRKENIVITPRSENQEIQVDCTIDALDANSIQQKYDIKVVLYEKKILGGFKEVDSSTIESVNIVTEFWEKDKVKILNFKPPENWSTKGDFSGLNVKATEKESVYVDVLNSGAYEYDVVVRVDLVEKTSLGIPLTEGFGEIKKEIGEEYATLEPGEDKEICVCCELKEADRDKRVFNLQATLFVDIDGVLYEVDESTIQSVKVSIESWGDALIVYGPWIWIIIIAATGTLLLIVYTVRVIWPYSKYKKRELEVKMKNKTSKEKKE